MGMGGATVAPVRIAGAVPILTNLLHVTQSPRAYAIIFNCLGRCSKMWPPF